MKRDIWARPGAEPTRAWAATIAVMVAVVLLGGVGAAFVLTRDSDAGKETSKSGRQSQGEALVSPAEILEVIAPDSIPSIDQPKFVSLSEADFLTDREPVVVVTVNDDARAYPLQIMTWHEIVNDEIGGRPVAVTFCPLCNTAVAFRRPEIDGEVTTFGTSGKLLHSNLLMYDRATESLWAQATGIAVQGPKSGQELERINAQIVSWEEFKESFPDGKVLSRDTGFNRTYGDNPYPGYDDIDSQPFLFTGEVDGRLAAVERVLGVQEGNDLVAYPYFRLEKNADGGTTAVNDEVGAEPVVVLWKSGTASALDKTDISGSRNVGAATAFSREVDGVVLQFVVQDGRIRDRTTGSTWNIFGRAIGGPLEGKRLGQVKILDSFWFDWAAFHPGTRIWRG